MTFEEIAGVVTLVITVAGVGYKINAAQSEKIKNLRLELKADNAKLHSKIDSAFDKIAGVEKSGAQELSNTVTPDELRELRADLISHVDRVDDRLSLEIRTVREQIIVQLKAFADSMRGMASFLRKGN